MENASLPPSSRPLRFSCEQNKSVSCSTRQISIQTSFVSQAVIRMAGAGPMMAATTTIGGPPILLVSDDGNELPKLPEKRPQSARERHGIARAITRYLREASHTFRLAIWIARAAWLADEAARDITTYFDEPKTLEELRDAVDDPEKGYDIHHIVEQGPARSDGFPEAPNTVAIEQGADPKIQALGDQRLVRTSHKNLGGLSPREYLRGTSWKERTRIGLNALIEHGVLNHETRVIKSIGNETATSAIR